MDLFSIIYFLIGSCVVYWLASHIPGSRYYDTSFKGYLILIGMSLFIALFLDQCDNGSSYNDIQERRSFFLLQHKMKRLKELNDQLDDLHQIQDLKNKRKRVNQILHDIDRIHKEIEVLHLQ